MLLIKKVADVDNVYFLIFYMKYLSRESYGHYMCQDPNITNLSVKPMEVNTIFC